MKTASLLKSGSRPRSANSEGSVRGGCLIRGSVGEAEGASQPLSTRPRGISLLVAIVGLVSACSKGGADRVDPFSFVEPVKPISLPDAGPQESESELLAREHQPVTDPVPALSEGLAFGCEGAPPGRVLQRLNRLEYNNTVRDLFGVNLRPADEFPKDDFGDSFDNNAAALSVSPLLAEAYVDAAEQIADTVMDPDGEFYAEFVTCTAREAGAANCARQVLTPFLSKAFRRPLFDAEVDEYVALVEEALDTGASFDESLGAAIQKALLSAHFLFRVELDVDPDDEQHHSLTQHELASRLSYFLWSSMPDAELTQAANAGRLSSEDGILEQVDRMLADPKSSSLLHAFAGRWLETADISEINQPAADYFPEFTPELEAAMEEETRLFMHDVFSGELPFSEILTADYTYVNAALAEHYGIEGSFGDEFERVSLADTPRSGLLTHGSVLTLTAAPTRTSVVRRGVWVLTNLLCSAPPPPPPDVQGDLGALELPEGDAGADAGMAELLPLGERAKAHSEDPTCAGCHVLIDPIGLGLENFDTIGRHRTEEHGQAIDASGVLRTADGELAFEGAKELAQLLSEDERLHECATRKLYTFALGRLPQFSDEADSCRVEWLGQTFEDSGYDFSQLIRSVVLTDSFRGRRGGLEQITRASAEED